MEDRRSLEQPTAGSSTLEITVSRNRIALSLEERSGNIWIAELDEHR